MKTISYSFAQKLTSDVVSCKEGEGVINTPAPPTLNQQAETDH